MVLHAHKARPALKVGEVERLGELPGEHGRCADVAHLAGLHQIVQRLKRFLNRGLVVPAMNLE